MSYIEQLEKAISLATQKHFGQVDKSGNPYILHPLYVMCNVNTIEEKIVAILHDIIEDTDITSEDLENIGINDYLIDCILLLTRDDDKTYMEYVKEIKTNEIARNVKIADLKHNMDLSRIKNRELTNKDFERNKKYMKAYYFLTKQ